MKLTRDEEIKQILRNNVLETIQESINNQNKTAFVYLSDSDGIGPSYSEKIQFLNLLSKEGVIIGFKEVEKKDELEMWSDLEIEQNPDGWFEYKENFSPEERIYAEVSFDPKNFLEKSKQKKPNNTPQVKVLPSFNKQESKIYFGNESVKIPIGTNMSHFCEIMFDTPFGEFVSEGSILNVIEMAETKECVRTVYDAMNRVNRIIQKEIGIEKLFERKNNNFRIKKELFK